jgi:hypothetical protein
MIVAKKENGMVDFIRISRHLTGDVFRHQSTQMPKQMPTAFFDA